MLRLGILWVRLACPNYLLNYPFLEQRIGKPSLSRILTLGLNGCAGFLSRLVNRQLLRPHCTRIVIVRYLTGVNTELANRGTDLLSGSNRVMLLQLFGLLCMVAIFLP
jgi:hypothetical protein